MTDEMRFSRCKTCDAEIELLKGGWVHTGPTHLAEPADPRPSEPVGEVTGKECVCGTVGSHSRDYCKRSMQALRTRLERERDEAQRELQTIITLRNGNLDELKREQIARERAEAALAAERERGEKLERYYKAQVTSAMLAGESKTTALEAERDRLLALARHPFCEGGDHLCAEYMNLAEPRLQCRLPIDDPIHRTEE